MAMHSHILGNPVYASDRSSEPRVLHFSHSSRPHRRSKSECLALRMHPHTLRLWIGAQVFTMLSGEVHPTCEIRGIPQEVHLPEVLTPAYMFYVVQR
jgi:hypothetical protein